MRRYRRAARRFYGSARRRAQKMTLPLAPIAGIMAAPAIQRTINELMVGNFPAALKQIGGLAGLQFDGKFDLNTLLLNAKPIAAGMLVHKGANMLGVNRILAKAKIPLVRI